MTRPAFGGNTIATIACPDNRPQMATVRPGVMQKLPKEAGRKAEVIEFNPTLEKNNRYVDILNVVKAVGNVENIMVTFAFLCPIVCIQIHVIDYHKARLCAIRESDFPDFINILFRPFTGKAPSQQVPRSPDNDDSAHRLHRWKV